MRDVLHLQEQGYRKVEYGRRRSRHRQKTGVTSKAIGHRSCRLIARRKLRCHTIFPMTIRRTNCTARATLFQTCSFNHCVENEDDANAHLLQARHNYDGNLDALLRIYDDSGRSQTRLRTKNLSKFIVKELQAVRESIMLKDTDERYAQLKMLLDKAQNMDDWLLEELCQFDLDSIKPPQPPGSATEGANGMLKGDEEKKRTEFDDLRLLEDLALLEKKRTEFNTYSSFHSPFSLHASWIKRKRSQSEDLTNEEKLSACEDQLPGVRNSMPK